MKKNNLKIGFISTLLLILPSVAFADNKTLQDVVNIVVDYFKVGVYFIIALAFITFVWNVYRYFFLETEKRKEAGMYVLYSTVGFFVILSIWGLVALLTHSFNLDNNQPQWPFGGTSNTRGTTGPGARGL